MSTENSNLTNFAVSEEIIPTVRYEDSTVLVCGISEENIQRGSQRII